MGPKSKSLQKVDRDIKKVEKHCFRWWSRSLKFGVWFHSLSLWAKWVVQIILNELNHSGAEAKNSEYLEPESESVALQLCTIAQVLWLPEILKGLNMYDVLNRFLYACSLFCLSYNKNPCQYLYADHMRPLMDDSASKFVEEMFNKIDKARKTRKRKVLPLIWFGFVS